MGADYETTGKVPPNSLLVAIPSIGWVIAEAYESMLLAFSAAKQYWEKVHPLSVVALRIVARKPADNARNFISKLALEAEFDWIWWVDDDMEIPERALERLHHYKQPMASALYATKDVPPKPLIFKKMAGGKDDPVVAFRMLDGLTPEQRTGRAWVDGTGLGCFLMRREVLQKVWDETKGEPFRWSLEMTDDIHFFDVSHRLGYKILLDMDMKIGHWGVHQYQVPTGVVKHEVQEEVQEVSQPVHDVLGAVT